MNTAEKLPLEIIVHILKYLTFKDRKKICLVNKLWYQASMHPMFIKHEKLIFNSSFDPGVPRWLQKSNEPNGSRITDPLNDFIKIVLESKRKILNLQFTQTCSLQHLTPALFSKRGQEIKSLSLVHEISESIRYYNLSETYLTIIMSLCQNLETLEIAGSTIKNFSVQLAYTTKNCGPKNSFLKLKHLYLTDITFSETSFKQLTKHVPNLDTLCLKCVTVKSVIPKTIIVTRALRAEHTCLNVINYLKNAQNITTLEVDLLGVFMKIPAHITLNSLKIYTMSINCDNLNDLNDLKLKLETLKYSLVELEIVYIPCCLLAAIEMLLNLQHLTINNITSTYNCPGIKICLNKFLTSLSGLKHLKKLSIFSEYYDYPLFVIPQCTISSLTSLESSVNNIQDVFKYGKHLSRLIIFNCHITSSDLIIMCTNLLNLKYLKIFHYNNLEEYNMMPTIPFSNLRNLSTLIFTSGNFNHNILRIIKHSNLKKLTIKSIYLTPFIDKMTPKIWSEFDEGLKILAVSVPELTSLCIYISDVIPRWYDSRIVKSYFRILEELEIVGLRE